MAARRAFGAMTKEESMKILGVTKGMSQNAIRATFLQKAKTLHPDMPTGSEEQFKQLMSAYSFLLKRMSDPEPQAPMYEYDLREYKSYRASHSRHHKFENPEESKREYGSTQEWEEVAVSRKWVVLGLGTVVCLIFGSVYLVYHSWQDHLLGGQIRDAYRTENFQVQSRFFTSQQLRARRSINF